MDNVPVGTLLSQDILLDVWPTGASLYMQSTASLGSSKSGVSRDVQDELMSKGRKRLRDVGHKKWSLPYPLVPTGEQFVFENWNCLFLDGLVRAVSMHPFEEAPSRVLELGCGTGVWVLEACRLWPKASFVGLDISKCQPDLSNPELERTELAPRVTWVNTDFLEPLPFEDGQFDFVRMSHIALAVPEDEWQYLFEECARILEPGGIIEIVEEDLIFPCGRAPRKTKEDDRASHSTGSHNVPQNSTAGSVSTLSFTSTSSILSSENKFVSPGLVSPRSTPPPSAITQSTSIDSSQSQPRQADQYTQKDPERNIDPKDHTRLVMAWDAMLHSRFLAPQVSSVLPFYLSTCFSDIRMMPSLHILLPPSTEQLSSGRESFDLPGQGSETPQGLAELFLSLQLHGNRLSVDRTGGSKAQKQPWKHATITSWASIHLARSLDIIRACKDAMWDAYLEGRGFGERPEGDEGHLRDDFETAWKNWEADMKDRMCMRAKLHEALAWVEPGTSAQPDWKVWRERANEMEMMEMQDPFGYYIAPENLCRSIKGFVGYKPKT